MELFCILIIAVALQNMYLSKLVKYVQFIALKLYLNKIDF